MGLGGGCNLLCPANFLIWLTIVGSLAAMFAPFWSTLKLAVDLQVSSGLFITCYDPYHKSPGVETECMFGSDNIPDWHKAVLGLWVGGSALMFLVGVCNVFLCCERCKKASCTITLFVGVLVAALAFVAAVVVFGIYQDKDLETKFDRGSNSFFDWGYYVAIGTAGLALLTSLLFAFVICCVRKEK